MFELLQILVRYILVAVGIHYSMKGVLPEELMEPFIGAGMALFGILWMIIIRVWPKLREHYWPKLPKSDF